MSHVENVTQLVISINSGSAIVVRDLAIIAIGVDPSTIAYTQDTVGNITSMSTNVPVSRLHAITIGLLKIPGINGISTPDIDVTTAIVNYDTHDIVAWVMKNDISIQFTGGIDGLNGPEGINHYAGPKEGVTLDLVITNGHGILNNLNQDSTVLLTAAGGTSPMLNGQASPVLVHFSNGHGSIAVSDSVAGTVTVTMSSASHPFVTLAIDTASVALA